MSVSELGYDLALRAALPIVRALAPLNAKLKRGVAGRAGALAALREWSTARRQREPLIWVHAPSVGESLMAQAIIQALRSRVPEAQIAFTHFSPSAERMRERVGADIATYLPWDTSENLRNTLDLLRPSAIAFVRSEIWPNLVRHAARRDIPTLLVNAVLSARSSRLRPVARNILGPAYRRLSAVGAINEQTAARYQRLGVAEQRIRVTGDARFDQVWRRVQALQREQPLLRRLRDPAVLTLVAGSTWPADERALLPAVARIAADTPLRVILAPHEPVEEHLRQAEQSARAVGLSCTRLADVEADRGAPPAVVLVDRVGVLADLYAIADVAFVGGAFQGSGVHSVVEPAALGVPVLFGPNHSNAEEAGELVSAGGALSVADAQVVETSVRRWLDPTERGRAGKAAQAFTESRLGGAAANALLILESLGAVQSRSR
jgi:3-deoxy-D-manno-octulosonic-acid transferase